MTQAPSYAEKLTAWTRDYSASERAAISRKSRAEIARRFGEIAARHGYVETDHGWVKTKMFLRLALSIQPSRHGFQCFINLSSRPRSLLSHIFGVALTSNLRLTAFYDRPEVLKGDLGALTYHDVANGGTELEMACLVLDHRALPYLDLLTGRRRHDLFEYRNKCAPLPSI